MAHIHRAEALALMASGGVRMRESLRIPTHACRATLRRHGFEPAPIGAICRAHSHRQENSHHFWGCRGESCDHCDTFEQECEECEDCRVEDEECTRHVEEWQVLMAKYIGNRNLTQTEAEMMRDKDAEG